ncbi:energy-coupling factor transporter transmembrane component T [Vagococcus sp. JNUCC 83]
MEKRFIKFDPRSKLLTVIFASLLLISRANPSMELVFMVFITILLCISGSVKKGLIIFTSYIALYILTTTFFYEITGVLSAIVSFVLVVYKSLLPPISAGMFATQNTSVGEWVAAMKKWHLPNFIVIPFIVICRFFPTLRHDFKSIRQAMKFRGIYLSVSQVVRHPIQTMEYFLVPILKQVDYTAQELSAAALVRGLGYEGQHTSVISIKLKLQDYLLICSLLVLLLIEGGVIL